MSEGARDYGKRARLYNRYESPRIADCAEDPMSGAGSLVCVGIGMTLGSHLGARDHIEKSDVVCAATAMQPIPEVRERPAAIDRSASGNA